MGHTAGTKDGAAVDAAARVAVLGPTSVDGQQLTRNQRPIVAALALADGATVSVGELLDAVWPSGAPASARPSLQNQVTRLRRRFGTELIETLPGGYCLGTPSDARRFETEVAPWLERGAGSDALRPLERVLSWWAGTPYEDLADLHAAEPERARLESLQAAAADQLARCRIVVGQLRRASLELEALVRADPYRDQRWELLMVSLHLAQRRSDALAAYDRAAAVFERELGAEPSAALQRLRALVVRDGALDAADWALPGLPRHQDGPVVMRRKGRCSSHRTV